MTVVWLMVTAKGGDVETTLFVAAITAVLAGIFIYAAYKQSKTPVVETNANEIKIHYVWRNPEKVSWSLVTGLKKYALLGYKLETLGESIWLPIGMLTSDDAIKLLQEISDHVQEQTE